MQEENRELLSEFAARLNARSEHQGFNQTQIAEKLGVKYPRVSNWFQGRNFPRAREKMELAKLLKVNLDWLMHGIGEPESFSRDPVVNEALALHGEVMRQVPVISWTHAGDAVAYEEMPRHFMGRVETSSRDPRAFAVTVEGDSMEPKVFAGDRVVCEPSRAPINGKPVVAKHADDGVQLRIYHKLPSGRIRLAPLNPVYLPVEHSPEEFHWIFPIKNLVRDF